MKTALKLIGLVILGLCAGWASAQSAPVSGYVVNQYGQPVPNATIRVCSVTSTGNPCTPLAAIYYDFNLTMQAPNPYTSDSAGNYAFYVPALAAPNTYVVQLTPTNGQPFSYLVGGPYCSLSGCTFTGPVTGTIFNATTFPYYEINGVQIASTNLLDTANIAYINASNTFTGSVQTAPTWNATTGFTVNGTLIACVNLSDCANLAKINASNTFTGATNTFNAISATTIRGTVVNATTGFQNNGAAPSNHVLLGNGTNYVDSATIPYSVIAPGGSSGPFAAAGVPYATSTTASTVATSPQLVTALNTSPSTTLAVALLPVATTSTLGAVEPDNSTITISAGVISAVATSVTQHNVTGSRTISANSTVSSIYQNTTGKPMWIGGWGTITGGSGDSEIDVVDGPTSPPTVNMWGNGCSLTTSGEKCGFGSPMPIPAGYYYSLTQGQNNHISTTPGAWYETY